MFHVLAEHYLDLYKPEFLKYFFKNVNIFMNFPSDNQNHKAGVLMNFPGEYQSHQMCIFYEFVKDHWTQISMNFLKGYRSHRMRIT